jgi:transcriptional regulator GlxA family with amidase domain
VTSRPAAAHHLLRDLAQEVVRLVRDRRIVREDAQPLDVVALARGAHMSAGHLSRQFRLAYGESPYAYLMTRRIERAMALLRRGDLSVAEVCFAVGCFVAGHLQHSLHRAGRCAAQHLPAAGRGARRRGCPSCVAKQVESRAIGNREVRARGRG